LTAVQLSQLPPSVFLNITAQNLTSIPPAACEGFKGNQIGLIPVEAAPGFTAAQVSYLEWYELSSSFHFTTPHHAPKTHADTTNRMTSLMSCTGRLLGMHAKGSLVISWEQWTPQHSQGSQVGALGGCVELRFLTGPVTR
jgi:hypothetical protein